MKQGVQGSNILGSPDATVVLAAAEVFYTRRFVFAANAELDLTLVGSVTTGSDTFVEGAAQVETATAAGTITTAGNALASVTATGLFSPEAVSFAVALTDTASQWAAKCRAALAANAVVSSHFTVGGSGTSISLTRKPTYFTVPGGQLGIHFANNSSLNIFLADDTSAGITEASSSANTTAGVVSEGVKIYGSDGLDHEGSPLGSMSTILAIRYQSTGTLTVTDATPSDNIVLSAGEDYLRASASGLSVRSSRVFEAGSTPCALTVTVVGTNSF